MRSRVGPGVVLLLGFACAFPADLLLAQDGAVIVGRVEDATTGQPVEGARVASIDFNTAAFTDSLGAFLIVLEPSDSLSLYVEQYGYLSQQFDLPQAARRTRTRLLLQPAPIELDGVEVLTESSVTKVLNQLRSRRNAYFGSVSVLDRRALERSGGTVFDLLRARIPAMFECTEGLSGLCVRGRGVSFQGGVPAVPLHVCVDSWESYGAASELGMLDVRDVALLEIYSMGRGGVRVYTPTYLASAAIRGRSVVNPYGC